MPPTHPITRVSAKGLDTPGLPWVSSSASGPSTSLCLVYSQAHSSHIINVDFQHDLCLSDAEVDIL